MNDSTRTRPFHVEVRQVQKRFGAVQALTEVDLGLERGQVHALVGENGAGKSTLGRLLAGVHAPDGGAMLVDGRSVSYNSPRDALVDGITIIAQELTLVPQRSVADNVFLGSEIGRWGWIRRREVRARYLELAAEVGFDIDPSAIVGTLRLADQQKVEILRALARGAELIVMDEPTAALSAGEVDRLLDVIRGLRDRGTTVVFVTHFLDQVLAVADTVTVLRDGRLIDHRPAADQTADDLVAAMLGRPMDTMFPPKVPAIAGPRPLLSIRGLSRRGAFDDVSFDIFPGEILGIAGLVGSGRTEVLRGIFGADRVDSGVVELDGRPVSIRSPRDAVRRGLVLVPESRKDEGLILTASIRGNITLPHLGRISRLGWLNGAREARSAEGAAESVGVRGAALRAPVSSLSGGNQQKVLFAKWLLERPRVLLVDEPTRGVDVGARRTIYELLANLAADGMGIVMVSSDAEEVLGVSHRVVVMRQGRVVDELIGADVREDRLITAAFGSEEGVA